MYFCPARGSLALITLDRPFPSLRSQCALVRMNQKNAEKCYAVLDENASSREPKNCMISEFKLELCDLCSKCLTTHLLSFFQAFFSELLKLRSNCEDLSSV